MEVGAVCLYLACRKETFDPPPVLLIDFSDVLRVNVFKLGSVYLELLQKLFIEVPQIDPSLFIHRFCARLEFEGKKNQVAMTAIRLMQSMNRAWITTGRRPNGLCGAAILIAARYHGFKRSINQIVRVVHVCQETIRKRLDEFKDTRTAQLTREELQSIEASHPIDSKAIHPRMEEDMDPPSFTKNHLQKTLMLENGAGLEELHQMMEQKGSLIDQKLNKYDNKNGIDQEEIKMSRENSSAQYNSTQIVPYFNASVAKEIGSNLSPFPSSSTSFSETPLFGKRSRNSNEEGVSYLALMKTDPDGVISLSDVDDAVIDEMILDEDEKRLKKIIWNNLNADWIKEQKEKKRARKE